MMEHFDPDMAEKRMLGAIYQSLERMEKHMSQNFDTLAFTLGELQSAVDKLSADAQPEIDALKAEVANAQAAQAVAEASAAAAAQTVADAQAAQAAAEANAAALANEVAAAENAAVAANATVSSIIAAISAVDASFVPVAPVDVPVV